MKTTEKISKGPVAKAPLMGTPVVIHSLETQFPMGMIQWPDERQIHAVSARLAQLRTAGIRMEAAGDYFNSGDLAYQIQEIIRTTAELVRKSERARG